MKQIFNLFFFFFLALSLVYIQSLCFCVYVFVWVCCRPLKFGVNKDIWSSLYPISELISWYFPLCPFYQYILYSDHTDQFKFIPMGCAFLFLHTFIHKCACRLLCGTVFLLSLFTWLTADTLFLFSYTLDIISVHLGTLLSMFGMYLLELKFLGT